MAKSQKIEIISGSYYQNRMYLHKFPKMIEKNVFFNYFEEKSMNELSRFRETTFK